MTERYPTPPTLDIQGKKPGPTLLITAGMDGDEYAGIEAAHQLIAKYNSGDFNGKLIVVPIVNEAGFANKTSHNPTDGKLPKNIFPGRARGTASEQLVHWLNTACVAQADAWLDLHGGATGESLTPFLWVYQTGVQKVDALTENFYKNSGADIVLLQRAGIFSGMFTKPRILATRKRPCVYVLAESGERGERKSEDSTRHVQWAEVLMQQLGMLPDTVQGSPKKPQLILHKIKYGYAGQQLPTSKHGTVLWHKDSDLINTTASTGEILYGIGY